MKYNRRYPLPGERALTLIELVVVVTIIGLLTVLLVPALGQMRKTARSATCLSQMRQIGMALILYPQDNDSRLPGPLWRGQSPFCSANSDGSFDLENGNLANFLAPYLNINPPAPGHSVLVEPFSCPAWYSKNQNNGKVICYYSCGPVELPDGSVGFPFGRISSNEAESTPPMRLAALTDPASTPTLGEFDMLLTSATNFYGTDIRVPLEPVHQSSRQLLFFDAHVASIPVR